VAAAVRAAAEAAAVEEAGKTRGRA
jgi:hypothetical protein